MPQAEPTTLSLGRYTPDAKAWVVSAQALADERGHAELTPLHLLARGVEGHAGVRAVLSRAGVPVGEVAAAVDRALAAVPRATGPSYLSGRFLDLLARAEREADRERVKEVSVAHVLGALTQEIRGGAGEVLGAFGVSPGSLKPHLSALSLPAGGAPFQGAASVPQDAPRDLVREAVSGEPDPVVGRDAEIRRLVTILERREQGHPLLVGEPGVGKRAIVRALSRRIGRGEVPSRLASARVLEVDATSLAMGARTRADAEARLAKILEGTPGDVVLFVRGLDQLFSQGSAGSAVGEVVRQAVLRGRVKLLGTTTPEGARRLGERDGGLSRLLTVLEVGEPGADAAIEILRAVAARLETHHGVRISEGAVVASVTLAKRYLQDRFLPESAVGLLDEAAAALRVETEGAPAALGTASGRLDSLRVQLAALEGVDDAGTRAARERLAAEATALEPEVTRLRAAHEERRRAPGAAEKAVLVEAHVATTVGEWTGIPVSRMLEGESEKLLRMEERLERRVVGQSEGVRALARAVRRGRVGLRDPRRPIGSFLFLGPSGVGKTELAKALAAFLFDDEAALTRLDMSEFMERHMAQRLLGAPPGYADSEQGGFLTEAVRKRPYSVLLFDEVEKAHEDVFNLLLQVLDDGRLTDGRGRLADFTNTVVILTSNIGSDRILESDPRLFDSREGRDAQEDVLKDQLAKFFRPEFLNRVDDVIVFRPLSREDLGRIVDIQLDGVRALLAPRKVSLAVEEPAKARLVELGYQPALGARPLRRAILKGLQDPLAEKLLDGSVADGGTLRVRLEGDDFVFETVEAQ